MKLSDYLEILRAHIIVVVVTVLLVLGVAVLISFRQTTSYSATTRIELLPSSTGSTTSGLTSDPNTDAQLVTSEQVAEQVKLSLNLPYSVSELISHVQAAELGTTSILFISATSNSSTEAVNLANAFANQFLIVSRAQAVQRLNAAELDYQSQLQKVRSQYDSNVAQLAAMSPTNPNYTIVSDLRDQELTQLVDLQNGIDQLHNEAPDASAFGQVIQSAGLGAPANATHKTKVRTIVFGVLIGLPVALALVLLLDTIADRLRSREDAARQVGVDVVGMIPSELTSDPDRQPGPVTLTDPFSPAGEAYRALGYNLSQLVDAAGLRTVIVTSPGEGEGKTSVTANVAQALAEAGRPITVLDADLRAPQLAELMGGDTEPGLADFLEGELMELPVQRLRPNLSLISAGHPVARPDLSFLQVDTGQILAGATAGVSRRTSNGPRSVAGRPGKDEPLLILDTAPVLQASEVSRLVHSVDGVLLVVRAGQTRRKAASSAADQIRRAGGTVVGVVMTDVRASSQLGVVGSYATSTIPTSGSRSTSLS